MTNFEKIAASPETLGTFLASLPIASGPWDEAFHRMFCDGCQVEDCDGQGCSHKVERGNPLWWLTQEAGEVALGPGGDCPPGESFAGAYPCAEI